MSIIRDTIENQRTTTPTKVGDAIGVDEAVNQGQLTSPTPLAGLNADLVDGVQGALLGVGGQGYAWVDETANRVVGTTYTNTTGKPIVVSVSCANNANDSSHNAFKFEVDGIREGVARIESTNTSFTDATLIALVPSGSTYTVSIALGTANITVWLELK